MRRRRIKESKKEEDELESPFLALVMHMGRWTARFRSTHVLSTVSGRRSMVLGGRYLFNDKGSMSDEGSEGKQESV